MKLNIEELAKQAGATKERDETFGPAYEFEIHQLEAFARRIVERCAQECEQTPTGLAVNGDFFSERCARRVRNLMEDRMSDLVKRLRNDPAWDQFQASMLMSQAADRIEQLERVLAQAREALKDGDLDMVYAAIAAIDEALK